MATKRYCACCGAELIKESQKIYCSNACSANAQRSKQFVAIEAAGEIPASGKFDETNRRLAHAWLEHKYGHVCSICGLSEWLGKPIMLIVDHIDGNSGNHKITNLRLVCPNCDAQLPTYKSRNLTNPVYVKGDRALRKSADYDRLLARKGLSRDVPRIAAKAICPICHSEFKKKHSGQKYCSKPCVAEALRKHSVS